MYSSDELVVRYSPAYLHNRVFYGIDYEPVARVTSKDLQRLVKTLKLEASGVCTLRLMNGVRVEALVTPQSKNQCVWEYCHEGFHEFLRTTSFFLEMPLY